MIDVGAYLIHAVCRLNGYDIVATRLAEYAVGQVDGFVAAVAKEYHVGWNTLHLGYLLLQLALKGVWIAVIGVVIRILVGIEEYVSLLAGIFVASGRVGGETPDIGAYQLF